MIYSTQLKPSITGIIPIIGGLLGGKSAKLSSSSYYDGYNYYDIHSKKEIIKLTPDQLKDKYISPIDSQIVRTMTEEKSVIENVFGMFIGDSEFDFVDSGQRAIDEKGKSAMNYDKYVKDMLNVEDESKWQNFVYPETHRRKSSAFCGDETAHTAPLGVGFMTIGFGNGETFE